MRQEKRKKRGGERVKSKSQDCWVTCKPQKLEILLSAYARTFASGLEIREVYDLYAAWPMKMSELDNKADLLRPT